MHYLPLQNFQENHRRIGLVVDEYGELQGLVTLEEDILEEIIGEFTTQAPSQLRGITPQNDGSVLVEGSTVLRDLNRKLDLKFPLDGPKTLNGLILEYFQERNPDLYQAAWAPIEIMHTLDRSVKVVKICPSGC